jgi:hypothetical protein
VTIAVSVFGRSLQRAYMSEWSVRADALKEMSISSWGAPCGST